jgi:hypothetical protein
VKAFRSERYGPPETLRLVEVASSYTGQPRARARSVNGAQKSQPDFAVQWT